MNNRTPRRLLLVDNDPDYRHSLKGLLEVEGYVVEEAATPEEAQSWLETAHFDLALVDIRLRDDGDPGDFSGLEIARRASELGIPCVIVTAFATVELARIALRSRGVEPYAKDIVPKSSGPQALLDAISVILSNVDVPSGKTGKNGLVIDLTKKLVIKNGIILNLSSKQYTLLKELYRNEGGVCNSEDLIDAIYRDDKLNGSVLNNRALKNLVDRVKEKVEDGPDEDGVHHEYILTVYGRGYRLNMKR